MFGDDDDDDDSTDDDNDAAFGVGGIYNECASSLMYNSELKLLISVTAVQVFMAFMFPLSL